MATRKKTAKAAPKRSARKKAVARKPKGDERKMVTVRLPFEVYRALGHASVDTGESNARLVELALVAYLPTVSDTAEHVLSLQLDMDTADKAE